MKKLKEKYKEKMYRFRRILNELDKDWISQRGWFEDLKDFDLGQNFYHSVLIANKTKDVDTKKESFYLGTIINATLKAHDLFGEKDEYKCGLLIEDLNEDDKIKKTHQKILDYLWWLEIYHIASRKLLFTSEQKIELEKKRKEFSKKIKDMEIYF